MHSLPNSHAQGCIEQEPCQTAILDNWAPFVGLSLISIIHPLTSSGHTCSVPLDAAKSFGCWESSAVPPSHTSALYSKSVVLLSSEIELKLHNQSTQRHSMPCSSTCMWQGTGVYTPLLPVLFSLNLSFCLFFTAVLQ